MQTKTQFDIVILAHKYIQLSKLSLPNRLQNVVFVKRQAEVLIYWPTYLFSIYMWIANL